MTEGRRHERISSLFRQACELDDTARGEFLDKACAEDAELRAEIEALLARDREADSGQVTEELAAPVGAAAAQLVGEQRSTIGPYRLLTKLGEGGMGEVWLAEQTIPSRRVALKIIKHGLDTKQVVARFEAERQALALMDHPCVAKVHDAGSTPQGLPYFVMEHVQGVPITEHCDRQRLTTRERLELFRLVCDGVQHAHQKAIIHRDLKPSNVLVSYHDGKSVPKIIDFGVAKATAQRLTEKTLFTEMGVLVGTPEYMSPEQAEMTGQNVDTRTDVYSLGVMLYELLTGALPFDSQELRKSGYEGVRRVIREEEPSKPSMRLSTLGGDRTADSAKRRSTDPGTLERQLRGDLDWITMRALEKDRARRYGSPAELAADLERHLQNQPVLAGPPSAAYRAGKFVKRHRLGVGAAATAMLVLVVFAVTMTVQAGRIARERDRANREAQAARQTSEFLEELFEISDPDKARGSTLTARELLDRSAERIRSGEIEREEVRARLLGTMGNVYRKLGLYESSEPLLTECLALHRSLRGDEHRDTLASMDKLAILYFEQGRYDEAETLFSNVLDVRERLLGTNHLDTLYSMNNVAYVHEKRGRYAQAEPLYREALERRKRLLGREHPDTLISMSNLASLYDARGRYAESEALYLETLETMTRVHGSDHPDTLACMNMVTQLYRHQGRYAEAESLCQESLATLEGILGKEHPETLVAMNNLANLYVEQRRFAEAEPLYVDALERRRRVLGDDHHITITSAYNLGNLYVEQDRYTEAEPLFIESLQGLQRVLGEDHRDTIHGMHGLAVLYKHLGRYTEAEPLYLKALEQRRHVLGADHPDTLASMDDLALFYLTLGRYDAAEPLYLESLRHRRHVLGEDHPDVLDSMNNLAWFLLTRAPVESRDPEHALALATEVVEGTGHKEPVYLDTLALAYHLTGDTIRAIETERRALSLLPTDDVRKRADMEKRLAEFEGSNRHDDS